MSEEKVFDKLRRPDVDEMLNLLSNMKRSLSPALNIGGSYINQFYPDITFIIDKVKLLESHGWQLDDFQKEIEKKSILSIVSQYNDTIAFPTEVLEHVKRHFPNAEFVYAGIKLNE